MQKVLYDKQMKELEALQKAYDSAPDWLKPKIQAAIDAILNGYDTSINNLTINPPSPLLSSCHKICNYRFRSALVLRMSPPRRTKQSVTYLASLVKGLVLISRSPLATCPACPV